MRSFRIGDVGVSAVLTVLDAFETVVFAWVHGDISRSSEDVPNVVLYVYFVQKDLDRARTVGLNLL